MTHNGDKLVNIETGIVDVQFSVFRGNLLVVEAEVNLYLLNQDVHKMTHNSAITQNKSFPCVSIYSQSPVSHSEFQDILIWVFRDDFISIVSVFRDGEEVVGLLIR